MLIFTHPSGVVSLLYLVEVQIGLKGMKHYIISIVVLDCDAVIANKLLELGFSDNTLTGMKVNLIVHENETSCVIHKNIPSVIVVLLSPPLGIFLELWYGTYRLMPFILVSQTTNKKASVYPHSFWNYA